MEAAICSEMPEDETVNQRQICRVNREAAKLFGLSLGQYVRIQTPNKTVIVRVQVYHCPSYSDVLIKHYSWVTENVSTANFGYMDKTKINFCQLKCTGAKEICVKLILKNAHQYNYNVCHLAENVLSEQCVRCLNNVVVTPGCRVDLSRSRLGTLYGIFCCFVESCSSKGGTTDQFSAVKVTEKTVVKVSGIQSHESYILLSQFSSKPNKDIVIGLENERQILNNHLKSTTTSQFSVPQIKRILLQGPSGCGKTSLLRQVARDNGAAMLEICSNNLVTPFAMENVSNLKAVFDKAVRLSEEMPCILFIDNVEAICHIKDPYYKASSNFQVTSALISQLIRVATVKDLLIVMATDNISSIDPSLRRPGIVDEEILVPVPDSRQRLQVLDGYRHKLPFAEDFDFDQLVRQTSGLVVTDLKMLLTHACRRKAASVVLPVESTTQNQFFEVCRITQADMNAALRTYKSVHQNSNKTVVSTRQVLWSDIGGLEDIKETIQEAVEGPMLHPELFETMGVSLTKGLLLYGPPGCGKTTLVHAAATACGANFLSVKTTQIYSMYVGDSEKNLAQAFQTARMLAPSVLFIDEIDLIVPRRSDTNEQSSALGNRIMSMLLTQMDGAAKVKDAQTRSKGHTSRVQRGGESIMKARDAHVLVVFATNRLHDVDEALLRPGRMDNLIYVPPPDAKGRLQVFKLYTKKMPLAADVNLEDLVEMTEGFNCATIKTICVAAAMKALTESITADVVNKTHFEEVLRQYSSIRGC